MPHPKALRFTVGLTLLASASLLPLTAQEPGEGAAAPSGFPRDRSTGEVTLHKWSGTLNVPDPIASAVDPQGRVYVIATTRRKVGDLDIRDHRMWIPNDVGLDSIEAKRRFFHETLAPGKTAQARGGLDDHNQDGSIDWKDLTHHTERIYQLRDTDGDGTADKMTVFAESFNTEVTGIGAGVMWHDGWVYATIAPDLWRLKDTNDDGVADVREIVATGFGIHIAYAGHDMHGLTVGPDGRIYWSIGDKGSNVLSREGKRFYHPNEGAVFRVEPDGAGFEVYAHGLRNTQEPAFNDFGDLIAVDNDADQQGERERFVYVAEGSDTGWRANYQYMGLASPWMREGLWKPRFEGQAAYILPAISSYSDGPAGFRYEPGTALGEGQRGNMILTEFPSGKMRAFRAEVDGASFKMVNERTLNTGVMGIGLSWHPDGSLIMVDWIGSYALDGIGAIWKVDAATGRDDAARREVHSLIQAGFTGLADARLAALLAHRDQRIRQGVQLELAKRGRAQVFLTVARNAQSPLLARIHAIWGYGQLVRRQAAEGAELRGLLGDAHPEIRNQTVKVLGDAAHTRNFAAEIIPLLTDAEPRVRAQAAIALGKWKAPTAVPALLAMAGRDGLDPTLRNAVVVGLTGAATPEQLATRATDASVAMRLASVVALRRLASPAITAFLNDSNPQVVEDAARAIHDDVGIPAALPALANLVTSTNATEPAQRRALNALFRLGTPEAAGRIADVALNPAAGTELRKEALTVLRTWPQPPPLDRVDGWARKLNPAPASAALNPKVEGLLALSDPAMKTLAIEVLIAHRLEASPAQIAGIVTDAKAPETVRAQALRLHAARFPAGDALFAVLDPALSPTVPDSLAEVALSLLPATASDRLVQEARTFLGSRGIPARQRAIALLANSGSPAAQALLDEQAAALSAGTLPAALQLDVIEALGPRAPQRAEQITAGPGFRSPLATTTRNALLEGGSVQAGRELIQTHLAAGCVACHRFENNQGSTVGPALRGIGRQRDAAALLQSLIEPSAVIVPGYGQVTLTLTSGETIAGTLVRETPEAVTVRSGDGKEQSVPRSTLRSSTNPLSVMPPMDTVLTPRELRDVVAYLRQL